MCKATAMARFGASLTEVMKLRGVKTRDLASMLGVSERTVTAWTSGAILPPIPRVVDICASLRCVPSDLLDEPDSPVLARRYAPSRCSVPERSVRKHIARALTAAIKVAGKSPAELASTLGMGVEGVAKWISGDGVPRTETLMRACEALGCALDDILGFDMVLEAA